MRNCYKLGGLCARNMTFSTKSGTHLYSVFRPIYVFD
jgi:hypothetical protein